MRKRILIAEHEAGVAETLERRLYGRGYAPRITLDAASALAEFDGNRPDLVIVSLTLPDDGGREVCRGIRMRPLGALVPILFLGTGREEVRGVADAIAAGADHFFRKPDGIGELLGKISAYIGQGDEDGPAGDAPVQAPVADERELLDALGRTDEMPVPPSVAAGTSGFFRAIRDVLASRPTPAAVDSILPPLLPEAVRAPAPAAPPPTENDWAALDSLLQGTALPSPTPQVPTADLDVMWAAAALISTPPPSSGALPLEMTPAPPRRPAAPPPLPPFQPVPLSSLSSLSSLSPEITATAEMVMLAAEPTPTQATIETRPTGPAETPSQRPVVDLSGPREAPSARPVVDLPPLPVTPSARPVVDLPRLPETTTTATLEMPVVLGAATLVDVPAPVVPPTIPATQAPTLDVPEDDALTRWTVGRRWTDHIDPLEDPGAGRLSPPTAPQPPAPPPAPVVAPPAPPPQAPVPLEPPALSPLRPRLGAGVSPAPRPAPVPNFEPSPEAEMPGLRAPADLPPPPPRQTLRPAQMPVLPAPPAPAQPAAAVPPDAGMAPAPGSGRRTFLPGQMAVLAPAPAAFAPTPSPDAATTRQAPVVSGGLDFQPPRRPAHDPTDALTALLDAGRPVELARRGIGELLAAVTEGGLAGRVEVASGGVLRRVFVDAGAPVYADSSEPAEDLVAFLANEGRLTRAIAAEARDRAVQTGASAEEILIEAGYLEPEDIYRALRAYVVERVLALFALEAGEATLVRGGPRPLDPVDLGMHPGRLILDGIRRKYGRLRLYRAFGTSATVPRPRTTQRPELPGLVLRHDETTVLSLIDGRRTALEIARTAQLHEIDTLAILFGLGVLRLIDAPLGIRPAVGMPSLEPEALLRAGAPRTDDQMPGFAEQLAQKYSEIQAADYHQILGVPRAATGAEIRNAWERLKRQFDPHRVRRDGPYWTQVREIAAVLDDAFAVLGNERLRARYEAHLL